MQASIFSPHNIRLWWPRGLPSLRWFYGGKGQPTRCWTKPLRPFESVDSQNI